MKSTTNRASKSKVSPSAVAKTIRPKPRPDDLGMAATLGRAERAAKREAQDAADFVTKKAGGGMCGSPKKMATGGKCRGMGAAKRGGKYGKSG